MAGTRQDATYRDARGVTIHYHVWPIASPRGVVQLAHGLGEYALRYEALAARLNAAGWSVWADEHRGHGQTGLEQWGGDRSRLGRLGPGGIDATVSALYAFSGMIREAHPGLPLVLLGHSWGSLMAQMLLNQHPADYDAVVLTGTAYRMFGSMDAGDLNRRHRGTGAQTAYEWLSRDPDVVAAAASDPLMFVADTMRLFGPLDALKLLGRPAKALAAKRDVPILIMVGSDDTLGGEPSARRLAESYLRRSGYSDVTAVVYQGARHEIFNETNRDEVIDDLVTWLGDRLP